MFINPLVFLSLYLHVCLLLFYRTGKYVRNLKITPQTSCTRPSALNDISRVIIN